MGGIGSGRPPDMNKRILERFAPVSNVGAGEDSEFILPNRSGDHSAGIVIKTPSKEKDIVNKAYVDDSISNIKQIRTFNINKGAVTGPTYLQSNSLSHSSTTGISMNRDGSVVGVAVTLLCSAFTAGGDIYIDVKVNDTTVFTAKAVVTGTGSFQALSTQTSGAYPVVSGDYIQVYLNYGLGVIATFSNVSGNIEVDA